MKKILFLFLVILSGTSFPQFTQFHPELDWFTIKGKHVDVHFHEGAERSARIIAKIADDVWDPITSLYGYEPDRVHFVVKDLDDYSNGATYFFDNKIEIWTSALDFDLRGTHNWLRNVISHEFTHMVQIQASVKTSRQLPAVFLQMLNYEDERRPDILYGFPNVIVSYPLAMVNMPAWMAEGTAQYMRQEFDYDEWDTHRDMILRSYALENKMLTWNEMGEFGKTSLGNESVYNSGFALTRYIAQKYGEDKLRAITKALGKLGNFTVDAAFSDVLGKNGTDIYNEWKTFVTDSYNKRIAAVKGNNIAGEQIAKEGFGNFYPVFDNNGRTVYYISNKTSDYFSPSSIYSYNLDTKEDKEIAENVRSTFSKIAGTNKLLYAKIGDDNPNWYNVHDLYTYDIDKKKETRLTEDLRANQPNVSKDGQKVVFIFERDGTTNLGIVNIDGKNFKQLTEFKNGEQVYNPVFSNDGSYILFDYSYHQGRDIARIDTNGSGYKILLSNTYDDRNPLMDKDGNLVYASDETGIFNIYRMNLHTGEKVQLTNVLGGAFMPAIDDAGNIAYAGYTSSGYKIFYITKEEQSKVDSTKKYEWQPNPPTGSTIKNGDFAKFDENRLKNFNDYEIPDYKKEKYTGVFSKMTFYPFIRYDNYNTSNKFIEKLKPGLYLSSSDMLNRYSIFAGGSLNLRMERDLFLIFDYRNKLPLLYNLGLKPEMSLEVYNISRKSNQPVNLGADTVAGQVIYDYSLPTDITYNLFEVDLAARHRIFSREQNIEFRYIFSRYSAQIGSFLLPNDLGLYPSTDDNYLIGSNFQVKYTVDWLIPYIDADINPVGMKLDLTYNYEMNKFNNDGQYEVVDGTYQPVYNHFDFHKLELNASTHIPLWKGNTLTTQIRVGNIFGPTVPDFFDFYLGGMVGMKAYPFYAVSGNKIAWLNLTYRFPLFKNIDSRVGHLYIDKIFMSVYGDAGNAWYSNDVKFKDFKKGAGLELRAEMSSFYMFPTMVFFNASYGFDSFTRQIREKTVTYGKEWRFYGGVLFGFDF